MTVADIIDQYLPMFDKSDPIYKSLLAFIDGVANPTINNPMDYNIGAISGTFEYNRQLTLCLKDQLFLNLATGKFLDAIAHDHIGIVRHGGEIDLDYVTRIQDYIVGYKTSPGAIIYAMRQFSPNAEPIIQEGEFDSAFCDVSFASNYTKFQTTANGGPYTVFPAVAAGSDTGAFFFLLILNSTVSADIPAVLELIDRLIVAGVGYQIQIEY